MSKQVDDAEPATRLGQPPMGESFDKLVQSDSPARRETSMPETFMPRQVLVVDEIRQLGQDNARLRQKIDQEISDRGRQIDNVKIEQARIVDDLKARLETREIEARHFSERLAKLENKESKNTTGFTMIKSSDSIPTQNLVAHQDEAPRNNENS
ncbi:hypothetical protein H9Q71_000159 [Fusarium xylarioides]|nr:hypothetical protein H9Q71_000159 [Fusarium xylarioides]